MQLSFDFYYDVEFELYAEKKNLSHFITKLFLLLPESILILDTSLKMITGYYENGTIVTDRKKILLKYLKKNLIFDILSYFPILMQGFYKDVIFNVHASYGIIMKFFQLLVFCKLKRIYAMIQNFEQIIVLNGEHDYLLSLLKVCLKLVFTAHINACVWHAVAYNNNMDDTTWLDSSGLRGLSWTTKYWNSLFWATAAMCTMGYGEKISPQNNTELFTGFCILLVSSFALGFTINSMKEIFDQMSKNEKELKENISIINHLMKKEKIDFELQGRVRKYLEYVLENEKNAEKESQVLNKLTTNLKREVLIQSNSKFLFAIPFFSKNFSKQTIQEASLIMRKLKFSPEEIIYKANVKDECSLYIINHGEIDHFLDGTTQEGKSRCINTIKSGDLFGIKSFFTEEPRETSAISKNISIVFEIKLKDFITILKKHPEDHEKYCMIKDQMKLYEHYESGILRCTSCPKSSHLINQCPYVHFIPDKRFLVSRHNYSQQQTRSRNFLRKSRKKIKALLELDKIDEALERLWDDEEFENLTVYDEDFNNGEERFSIEKIEPPMQILPETNENMEESKIYSPNPINMKTSTYLTGSINEKKTSLTQNLEEELISSNNKNEENGTSNRNSMRMIKSKSILRDMVASTKRISSKRISTHDVSSLKSITKFIEPTESLIKYMDMDALNNFKGYFPYNNSSEIVPKLKFKKIDFDNSPNSPSSGASQRKKRNNARRNTKTKTWFVKKESIFNDFGKLNSFQT